jgi:hypothetical protein
MSHRKLEDANPTGALDERRLPDGRRKITLRRDERQALQRRQRAEAAAALFLDLEEGRTWAQIADELDISPAQLRDLTKTQAFDRAYNQLFAELGHDPRYRAAQGALGDMLPLAIRELRALLTSPETAGGVKMRAIERVIALNGLNEPEPAMQDRQDMVKFLVEHNIKLSEVQITVPGEYQEALALPEGEVAEGQYREAGSGKPAEDAHSSDT